MRILRLPALAAILLLCGALPRPPIPVVEETIDVPLTRNESGTYMVPVECNGTEAKFLWSCGGSTEVSETFAKACGIDMKPLMGGALRDAEGKPIQIGQGQARIKFGGKEHRLTVLIRRDKYCPDSEKFGSLGADVAYNYQWQVDPTVPSLTLRPLGTPIKGKPVAALPLKETPLGPSLNLKVRGVAVDMVLLPGSSGIQADPYLQRKWDLASGKKYNTDAVKEVGMFRTTMLTGKDYVELAPNVRETDLIVLLLGNPQHPEYTPAAQSGVGQCLLSRFIYNVDAKTRQFTILERIPPETWHRYSPIPEEPATQPATQPGGWRTMEK